MSEKRSRVGFLWDSLSQNTGDQAIGVTFLRLAHQAGLSAVEPVKIGSPIHDRYRSLVIGGGELLQAPGHPYYDVFRVPGPHILNTVGTGGPVAAEYLNDYRFVSARSQRDIDNLAGFRGTVHRAPCLTVLFDRIVEGRPVERRSTGSIGLHLHPATATGSGLEEMMMRLKGDFGSRIVLLPFTRYNCDWLIEEYLAEQYDLPEPTGLEGPDEAFHSIRNLDAVITSSLHATIMAYISGVPFLAFGYADKVESFLLERELSHRLVSEPKDVAEKMELLDPKGVDWQDSLAADRRRAEDLLASIFEEVESTLAASPAVGSKVLDLWTAPSHPVQAHRQLMENHEAYGRRIAETLRFNGQLAQLERWIQSISSDAREGKEELAKVSTYCIQLEKQTQEQKQLNERCASHIKRLEAEIEAHRSLQNELEQYVRQLETEIGQHKDQEKELRDYILKLEKSLSEHEKHQQKINDYVAKLEAEIANHGQQQSR